MPSSSIFLINDASEYLLGGEVNFCSKLISFKINSSCSLRFSGNSVTVSSASSFVSNSKPKNRFFLDDALKIYFSSFEEIIRVFLSYLELDIWLAKVLFHIKE